MNKIDIVITWVDYSDVVWKREYFKYASKSQQQDKYVGAEERYRAQETFKYLFRGIEKYIPWANRIYFVTYGHVPSWLNVKNEKLVIVKHSDFIPNQYLPTFNSNTILLNLHRIKDLSNQFILFNDDMYVTNYCKETLFFRKNKPCDMAVLNPIVAPNFDPFWDMMINDVLVINKHFDKRKVMKNKTKWFNYRYGLKNIFRNILFAPYHKFPGFYDTHLPNAHIKKVFYEVWDKEYELCNDTCMHKFRSCDDITEWTMRYWQLASNNFYPINKNKAGVYASLKDKSFKEVIKNCDKKGYRLVCFNDYNDDSSSLLDFFEEKFNIKSSFEK